MNGAHGHKPASKLCYSNYSKCNKSTNERRDKIKWFTLYSSSAETAAAVATASRRAGNWFYSISFSFFLLQNRNWQHLVARNKVATNWDVTVSTHFDIVSYFTFFHDCCYRQIDYYFFFAHLIAEFEIRTRTQFSDHRERTNEDGRRMKNVTICNPSYTFWMVEDVSDLSQNSLTQNTFSRNCCCRCRCLLFTLFFLSIYKFDKIMIGFSFRSLQFKLTWCACACLWHMLANW